MTLLSRLAFLRLTWLWCHFCHTRFLCQNKVLIICMTQDQLFHTYSQKCPSLAADATSLAPVPDVIAARRSPPTQSATPIPSLTIYLGFPDSISWWCQPLTPLPSVAGLRPWCPRCPWPVARSSTLAHSSSTGPTDRDDVCDDWLQLGWNWASFGYMTRLGYMIDFYVFYTVPI
jgi:hypothetical protein